MTFGPAMNDLASLAARQDVASVVHDRGLVYQCRLAEARELAIGLGDSRARIYFGLAAEHVEGWTKLVDEPGDQRLRDRRHRRDALANAAQIVVRAPGVIQHSAIHHRQADDGCQTLALDGL